MSLCSGWGAVPASSCTGSRVVDRSRTVFRFCETTVVCRNANVSVYCSGWFSTSCIKHNFQRRMSRLEQRWRAQRSVISIVNCRIPWTNRDLNVYCAFGISLKARLLQCLLIFMPLTSCTELTFGAVMCACLCVKELRALDAFSAQVLSTTSNLNNTSCVMRCVVVGHMPDTIPNCLILFKTWS